MQKTENIPDSSAYSHAEIYFKKEAANILGEFFILLGLSAVVDRIFIRNKGLGTAAALSAVALGLKITTNNINKQIPQELTSSPTNVGH